MSTLNDVLKFAKIDKGPNDSIRLTFRVQAGLDVEDITYAKNGNKHKFTTKIKTKKGEVHDQYVKESEEPFQYYHQVLIPMQLDRKPLKDIAVDFDKTGLDSDAQNHLYTIMKEILLHRDNFIYRFTEKVKHTDMGNKTHRIEKDNNGVTEITIPINASKKREEVRLEYYGEILALKGIDDGGPNDKKPKGKVVIIYSDGGDGGGR